MWCINRMQVQLDICCTVYVLACEAPCQLGICICLQNNVCKRCARVQGCLAMAI